MSNQFAGITRRSFETIVLWAERALVLTLLIASGWATYQLFIQNIVHGHNLLLGFIGTWLVGAYVFLPRLNRVLSRWYLPDYFIGRVRTTDGLLSDPVNLAFRGNKKQLLAAMHKAGWELADPATLRTAIKTVQQIVLKRSYPTAPVSAKFLFGRKQDFAFQQEVDGNPSRRHHVRFWRCASGWRLPGGYEANWLAAATYDRSVGFSTYNLQVMHKISENIDEERDHIIKTLKHVKATKRVEIVKHYSSGYHFRGGGGDSIKTDGAMPIITL